MWICAKNLATLDYSFSKLSAKSVNLKFISYCAGTIAAVPRQRLMHPPKPPKHSLTNAGAIIVANGAVIGFNNSAALIDPEAPKQAAGGTTNRRATNTGNSCKDWPRIGCLNKKRQQISADQIEIHYIHFVFVFN